MLFDMPGCGNCRTCEIGCSFHHTGEFKPSVASIKIIEKENKDGKFILLLEKNEGERLACDGCVGLDEPMCIEYCKERDELCRMIKEHLTKIGADRGTQDA